jgi:hypothetical protein
MQCYILCFLLLLLHLLQNISKIWVTHKNLMDLVIFLIKYINFFWQILAYILKPMKHIYYVCKMSFVIYIATYQVSNMSLALYITCNFHMLPFTYILPLCISCNIPCVIFHATHQLSNISGVSQATCKVYDHMQFVFTCIIYGHMWQWIYVILDGSKLTKLAIVNISLIYINIKICN